MSVGFDVQPFDSGQVTSLSLSLLISKMGMMMTMLVILLTFCCQDPVS